MKNLNKIIAASIISALFLGNVNAQTKKSSASSKANTSSKTTPTKAIETPKAKATETKITEEKAGTPAPVKVAETKKEVNDKPKVKTNKSYTNSQSSFVKGSKYLGGGASFSGGAVAVNLSAEYGLTDDISLGGVVWLSTGGSISGGVSANYCLSRVLKLTKIDPYVGATVSYQSGQVTSTDENGNRVDKNGIMRVVAQAGLQYRMSPKTVAFFQYSVGLVNGGNGYPSAGIKFSM